MTHAQYADENLKLGQWHSIDPAATRAIDVIPESIPESLGVRIIPQHKIVVDLDYDGRIAFQQCFSDQDGFIVTFPPSNPVFNRHAQIRGFGHRRFEANYSAARWPELVTAIKKTPRAMLDSYNYENPLAKKLPDIEGTSLEEGLRAVHNLARKLSSWKDQKDIAKEEDMDYLIEQVRKEGKFDGDCTSHSTFVAGLIHSMGLYARRFSGSVTERVSADILRRHYEKQIEISKKLAKITGGKTTNNLTARAERLKPNKTYVWTEIHSWPEVYVPTSEGPRWFVMDSANDIFGSYPDSPIYFAQCPIPNLLGSGKRARMRVDYKKV